MYNTHKTFDKQQSIDQFLYEWERVYGLTLSLKLSDIREERSLYDFVFTLNKIDTPYATNLELRINENTRQRLINTSIKLIQLEDIIEEFRHYYSRHEATRSERVTPVSFTTTHNGIKVQQRSCLCGSNHFFKECFYLNSNLRPSGRIGKDPTCQKMNVALLDPRRVKIKTLDEKN